MPTDEATRTVVVEAPFADVLEIVRDVESQPSWVAEILEAELLEEYEDGLPATAWFKASAPVGTDEYTLEYEHSDAGLTWSLVKGRLQSAQHGEYVLRALDADRTEVTFTLRITHPLPLPGFVRRKVISGLVDSTVTGLQTFAASRPADAG